MVASAWAVGKPTAFALMRYEPGRPEATFIGMVDVVCVRDSRFVAVVLGDKPALGDTLLIEETADELEAPPLGIR